MTHDELDALLAQVGGTNVDLSAEFRLVSGLKLSATHLSGMRTGSRKITAAVAVFARMKARAGNGFSDVSNTALMDELGRRLRPE